MFGILMPILVGLIMMDLVIVIFIRTSLWMPASQNNRLKICICLFLVEDVVLLQIVYVLVKEKLVMEYLKVKPKYGLTGIVKVTIKYLL